MEPQEAEVNRVLNMCILFIIGMVNLKTYTIFREDTRGDTKQQKVKQYYGYNSSRLQVRTRGLVGRVWVLGSNPDVRMSPHP